jgi:hypothetical protein
VADRFLERTIVAACPSFRPVWDTQLRGYAPGAEPTVADFFATLRGHVLELLTASRVAEFAQTMRGVERLLGDADPVLANLLAEELVRPLAASVEAEGLSPPLVAPHLGPRTQGIWREGRG